METVDLVREVTGQLRAVKRAEVASQELGLVIEITVEEGDTVDEHEIIARLDDSVLRRELARLEAQLHVAMAVIEQRDAQLERRGRDVRRLERLRTSGGATENEYDDAVTAQIEARALVSAAKAELDAAEAELARVRMRLEHMTIRAPFAGEVVDKLTELGEWLGEGEPIVELVAIDRVDAWIDVPEKFMPGLASAESLVTIEVPGARKTIDSTDVTVIADTDPLARTFPIRVRLDNTDRTLRPGMSVSGKVPTGDRGDTMTVSKDAVLRTDAGSIVYFDAGGAAAPAPIDVQYAVGERFVVRSPRLQPGMRTIVVGNERVFPGQPLIDMDAPPPAVGERGTPQSDTDAPQAPGA
ncbi:MAG: efflux RND transporter periplasmic adaptor subunit [Planctomycetota bacterium]